MKDHLRQLFREPLFLMVLFAFWGGMVRGIRCKREEFTWWGFFSRVFSAGFGGLILGLLLKESDYSIWIQFAIVGIGGYAAVDLLPVFSDGLKSAVEAFKRIKIQK